MNFQYYQGGDPAVFTDIKSTFDNVIVVGTYIISEKYWQIEEQRLRMFVDIQQSGWTVCTVMQAEQDQVLHRLVYVCKICSRLNA